MAVNSVALRLGPLPAEGFTVQRSGIRWLRDDGQHCRAGEVIAFCNIGLQPAGRGTQRFRPFADEERDFQVAFATTVAGTLRRAEGVSLGGFLDQLQYYQTWSADFVIGHLDCAADARLPDGESLRLLMLAGSRATDLADVRVGMMTGWFDRSRAWWGDGEAPFGTLACMGICEQMPVIRGEKFAFLELFESVPGPAQVVYYPDEALVPCAAVVADQLLRTPESAKEIAADFARSFGAGPVVPSPGDWMFGGALLSALLRPPFTRPHDLLTRTGLKQTRTVDAVLMSLRAEPTFLMRHRRLGYAVHCHLFRIAKAGPGVHAWLRNDFERVRRTPDDIFGDYCRLIDAVRSQSDVHFLILNAISTSGTEQVQNYSEFARPIGNVLGSVRIRELNLMLHDLARARNVAIVDEDAIAADMGARRHAPDGLHVSGPLRDEIRGEIVRVLRDRGVPGFAGSGLR